MLSILKQIKRIIRVCVFLGFLAPVPALCVKDTETPENQDTFASTDSPSPGLHRIDPEETIQASASPISSPQELEDPSLVSSDPALSSSLKSSRPSLMLHVFQFLTRTKLGKNLMLVILNTICRR